MVLYSKICLSTAYLLALLAGHCIADGASSLHSDKHRIQHSHHSRPGFEDQLDLKKREMAIKTVFQYETVYVDQNGKPISTAFNMDVPQEGAQNYNIPGSPLTMKEEDGSTTQAAPPPPPTETPADSSEDTGKYGSVSPPAAAGGGDFEDGKLDCSQFPSEYGAQPLDYLGWGGWSGIQTGNAAGKVCEKGAYCSYSCPPGTSKSQWPSNQPADGQTRGGLYCNPDDGKLYLTRPEVKQLCTAGHGGAFVVNKLSKDVAICRTDYPGSENMVVPLMAKAGGAEQALTVVSQSDCFMWKGQYTTAQYYVNKAGVSQEDGCCWGDQGQGRGNWSPLVFGAGYTPGTGSFLSITMNGGDAGYDVEIVPDEGAKTVGKCAYKNNQINGGGDKGCTLTVVSGNAKYVFTSR